jgi:hypothetical protein
MYWILRTTAVVTLIALVFHCSLSTLAATGATIEGTVQTPCDPSKVSEVGSVRIQPVSGGAATTVAVDPSTGKFLVSELTEGQYELIAIGADGEPLSPEPQKLLLREGSNKIILSMRPPGCVEQDSDGDGISDEFDACPDSPPGTEVGADGCPLKGTTEPVKKKVLEDWKITLIYFGVVGVVAFALGDGEDGASPSRP